MVLGSGLCGGEDGDDGGCDDGEVTRSSACGQKRRGRKTMEAQWYYTDQGQRVGPVSPTQLKELATSGRLQPSDMVWKEGMSEWAAASKVKGLFPTTTQAPPPPPPLPTLPASPGTTQPTSVIPPSSTTPSQQPPATDTRVCDWCAESISRQALKCPHCHKWRRDIAQGRRTIKAAITASSVLACLALYVFITVWKASSAYSYAGPFSSLTSLRLSDQSRPWHERIETLSKPVQLLGFQNPPDVRYEFSINKFMTSLAGWAVIGLSLLSMLCDYGAFLAVKVLRQTTGLELKDILW